MLYDVGDAPLLTWEVRDDAGQLVDATVVVGVTRPDGTPVTPAPTVTTTGVGLYQARVQVDAVGDWLFAWSASGAVQLVEPGQFTVGAGGLLVASFAELKTHLNRTDDVDDAELRTFLVAATEYVEWRLGGPLTVQQFTERHRSNGVICPFEAPLASVESITPDFMLALDPSLYVVDEARDAILLRFGGYGWYTVVYRAGRTTIPERVKLAGLIVAAHLWETQNGGAGAPYPGEPDAVFVAQMGFAVPRRAEELLGPDPMMGIG